jgi:hypothetical protein
MMRFGQRFRKISWMLLLFSASLITYSGLFFLGVLPFMPIRRFWDGGSTALIIAGTLDLIGGLAVFVLVGVLLTGGYFRPSSDTANFYVYLKILTIFCVLGIIGDIIGGLYGIGAQIGLYTTLIDWKTTRPNLITKKM